jgi:hypothetical protein
VCSCRTSAASGGGAPFNGAAGTTGTGGNSGDNGGSPAHSGGGSGFTPDGNGMTKGVRSGNGEVTISW